jgi:RHS repeat-associated protein
VNQLTQDDQYDYTYDADGNLTSKTDISTLETTTYTFNADNFLVRIDLPDTTIVTYAYDPQGRRIEKNVDGTITRYIYDDEDILLELDGSNTVRSYYTHGPSIDEPLIMERDTDTNGSLDQKVFYHVDGLGSIKTLTDNTGAIVQTYLYDSFGNIVDQTGTVVNPYTYTAREYDTESGLYYYRARYYDASIGRFISEDPIGFGGGINFYVYVGNDPINILDPLGLLKLKVDPSSTQNLIDKVNELAKKGYGTLTVSELLSILNFPPDVSERINKARKNVNLQINSESCPVTIKFSNTGSEIAEDLPDVPLNALGIILETNVSGDIIPSKDKLIINNLEGVVLDVPGPWNNDFDGFIVTPSGVDIDF